MLRIVVPFCCNRTQKGTIGYAYLIDKYDKVKKIRLLISLYSHMGLLIRVCTNNSLRSLALYTCMYA